MNEPSLSSQQIYKREDIPDLTFDSPWQNSVIKDLNIACNTISIVCGITVLAITAGLRIYDKKLVDRVSLRLNAAISATDVVNSMGLLIYTFSNSEGASCTFSAFLIIWLSNQYIFLTTAIAFNLQWLFLHKKALGNLEKWYFICPIGLALITAIIPLAAGKLGYDEAQTYCWYTPSYTAQTQDIEWATYIVLQLICLAYCLVVVVIVAVKLKNEQKELDRHLRMPWMGKEWANDRFHDDEARHRKAQQSINRVVRRILLYPLVPIITQTGFIVSEIWMYRNFRADFGLNVWGVTLKALPGFFNLIAFSLDPAVYNVAVTITNDLIDKYGDLPKHTATEGSSGNATRPFDPTATDISLFEVVGNGSQSQTTPVRPTGDQGNKLMRWIVRNWLQPSAGNRRNSLIQVSSSDQNDISFDGNVCESKHYPNECPTGSPIVVPPSPATCAEPDVPSWPRPLSQISQIDYPVAPVSSSESSAQRCSSVLSDYQYPSSSTPNQSISFPTTSTASNVDPHPPPRRRRRQTNAGREMYHAL
ncbi:hypothetical protein K450DRAFT_237537 [Umbelopsis ramanniana AG]|uniref:G-protein coupled receptors family 2 profile 2 domain-containing protein n=1 Tax=Umbelopsis ramanniana AG TaxID=1314678 RepID=A0AAD5HDJ3_UMBRA|nr:uncharacterized protein K450DRAFT_237537 [Umbelopsis ramanniana AG]KAI8580247.1 hypothetical protein K450DRAFT_237537 [Umbelopsis ramanniana AG]